MKHLHDDDLVLYSDGEIRTAPTQAHLHVCRGCRDRLRALELDVTRLSPPPGGTAPPGARRGPEAPGTVPEPRPAWRRLLRLLAAVWRGRRGSLPR